MSVQTKKKLNPLYWVPSVYFAMGLPFVVINQVSGLMFSDLGASDARAAFWTSLLLLPWTLKPLWSPFLEMFKTKKFFVASTQMISGISFVLLALSLPLPGYFTYAVALLGMIAISGATHDIAGDGLYMTELDKKTQAQYIGWQGAFYNIAKVLANGGLVFLAGILKDSWGTIQAWMAIMIVLGAIMILLSLWHSKVLPGGTRRKNREPRKAGDVWRETVGIYADFFRKKHIVWFIAFIIIFRFAEGFSVKITQLFLKAPVEAGGLGMSLSDIGLINGTFGTIAFIVGSILGGYFVSSRGLRKALLPLICAFYLPNLAYMFMAIFQPSNLYLVGAGVILEYFGYGFGFVGLTLYMMQQVAPGNHTMAHYAFATGIMNLSVMATGIVSGTISDWLGYQNFFIFVMIATVPAFLIAKFVPFPHPDAKDVPPEEVLSEEIDNTMR